MLWIWTTYLVARNPPGDVWPVWSGSEHLALDQDGRPRRHRARRTVVVAFLLAGQLHPDQFRLHCRKRPERLCYEIIFYITYHNPGKLIMHLT